MRVGYLLAEKKAQALGLVECVKHKLNQLNIEVVSIDDKMSLESQGPFHMIIHKICDYQRQADQGDLIAIRVIKEMYNYRKNHACTFIDSIEMVFQLANRATMSQICEKSTFNLGQYKVYVPPWIEISDHNEISGVVDSLASKGVTYPILCKAMNAAEGPGAHDMQLIFNEYQLFNELTVVPCIAQSFINHNMNMCKIFVVGSSWCIVNRPSIRNFKDTLNVDACSSSAHNNSNVINHDESSVACSSHMNGVVVNGAIFNGIDSGATINGATLNGATLNGGFVNNGTTLNGANINGTTINGGFVNNGVIHDNTQPQPTIVFNSHEVSKPDSVSFLNKFAKRYQQQVSFGNNELLNDQVVDELIRRLQQVIPFNLMGIDIIVNGYDYGLIDINFLPGYDGMSNFYDEFFKLITSKLKINNPHRTPNQTPNGVLSTNQTPNGVHSPNQTPNGVHSPNQTPNGVHSPT